MVDIPLRVGKDSTANHLAQLRYYGWKGSAVMDGPQNSIGRIFCNYSFEYFMRYITFKNECKMQIRYWLSCAIFNNSLFYWLNAKQLAGKMKLSNYHATQPTSYLHFTLPLVYLSIIFQTSSTKIPSHHVWFHILTILRNFRLFCFFEIPKKNY